MKKFLLAVWLVLIILSFLNCIRAMIFSYLQNTFGPYFWPFATVCALAFTHIGKKCMIVTIGAYYLIMSKDKSFVLPRYDPAELLDSNTDNIREKKTKTLILIRHGESIWNEVFNRGINWKLPFRLFYALARETMLFVTSDSCLYDSPLSTVGIAQAQQIRQFIIDGYTKVQQRSEECGLKDEYVDILRNYKASNSLIVSSPLRRCIETVSLGLFDRINESKEKIVLHSSLQEMTRNIDGISLSYEHERPPLSLSMRGLENEYNVDWDAWFDERVSVETKDGFKSPDRRGDDRMRSFVHWLFQQSQDTVIVSGHSLWNRCFFKAYLPRQLHHPGKVEKIANGGAIALKFSKFKTQSGLTRYAIHPKSIFPIVKNFETKHAGKKIV